MAAQAGYDVAVLGGGPGGYVAAIRAAQLGLKVAVVERADLGGICANWGCIPTKALLHSAEVFAALREGAALGILCDNPRVDFGKIIARSRAVADNQRKGVAFLLKKNGIDHLAGTGILQPGPKEQGGRAQLVVAGKPVVARHIILATGARPKALPGIEPDGDRIITYFEAMSLPAQPRSLVVLGAGAIGIEFAYFYNAIGTQVTVLEALPRVLPGEDEEISAQVERALRRQGIEILTGARVGQVQRRQGEGVSVVLTDSKGQERTVVGERLLSAVGVRGNVDGLGLEACGVATERGFIKVDGAYRALGADGRPVPGVYAIGDVIGPPMLAHKASAEGVACVEGIAGVPEAEIRKVNYSAIPGATFCRPEVGSMGMTEARAREAGLAIKVGRFPFKVSGKGQATGETDGLVKVIVAEGSGEILGAHIVGGTASDMIAALTLARSAELTTTEVLHTVHAHPTFAEAMKGAVEAAYGEAIDL
jgi:dihydrolipoamide dehydrogenase